VTPTDVTKGLELGVMTSKHWIRRSLVIAALAAAAVGVIPPSLPSASTAQAVGEMAAGGEYHPLPPERIFDTRNGGINDTVPLGKKPTSKAGSEFEVQITGKGGVPEAATDVLAVVLNVTVANPEAQGNLAVRPSGAEAGTSSLVNFLPGRNVPNLTIVGVGADGTITVKLATRVTSRADVVIDVFGWISTSAVAERGARLIPAGPGRIVDTRKGAGTPLRGGESLAVQIRGADASDPAVTDIVPNSADVSAVMINITAINRQAGSRSTNIAATPVELPDGQSATTSNTNVISGLVKANMAIVPVGPDGKIYLRNHSGDIHLAIDVLGYFEVVADESMAGRIIPLEAPFRAFDTREPEFGNVPLGTFTEENWSFKKFAVSVTLPSSDGTTTLDNQAALIGNLTGTELTRLHPAVPVTTFLSVYPGDKHRPTVSNLNIPENENVPNMSLLRYGTFPATGDKPADPYGVKAYNHMGSLHYILDVYAIVLS
jgi:hypothetical protein